jgi:hypothetical protein
MGTTGLFFGLAFIGDEKIGRAYALSGFPLGFFLRGNATRRQPVPCVRVPTTDALGTAGLLFERAFSFRRSGRQTSPCRTHPASGRHTAEGAVDARSRRPDELRGVITVLGGVVINVTVVVSVVHREAGPGGRIRPCDR